MSAAVATANTYLPTLLTPVHPTLLPYALIDVFGAMRLSSVADWMARGVFDPPAPPTPKGKKGAKAISVKERAGVLQECLGILIVVFGGETFLAVCTGNTPSWLINPSIALLFALIHVVQTRTPLRRLLPSKPTLALELLLSVPDAIGRTLLLTRFSVLPLLHPAFPSTLPATPSTLILVPFILAVPFASLIFSATSFFSPKPKFDTPMELKPGGWMMVDAWAPVLVPAVFLTLIGPVEGWGLGLGVGEDEAVVMCMAGLIVVFVMRTVYNYGHKGSQWVEMVGLGGKAKTA